MGRPTYFFLAIVAVVLMCGAHGKPAKTDGRRLTGIEEAELLALKNLLARETDDTDEGGEILALPPPPPPMTDDGKEEKTEVTGEGQPGEEASKSSKGDDKKSPSEKASGSEGKEKSKKPHGVNIGTEMKELIALMSGGDIEKAKKKADELKTKLKEKLEKLKAGKEKVKAKAKEKIEKLKEGKEKIDSDAKNDDSILAGIENVDLRVLRDLLETRADDIATTGFSNVPKEDEDDGDDETKSESEKSDKETSSRPSWGFRKGGRKKFPSKERSGRKHGGKLRMSHAIGISKRLEKIIALMSEGDEKEALTKLVELKKELDEKLNGLKERLKAKLAAIKEKGESDSEDLEKYIDEIVNDDHVDDTDGEKEPPTTVDEANAEIPQP